MTTNHLTPDQLSALVDGSLAGRALADAERHLADCGACRDALAALSAQEEALRRVLARDPGEAYFASFADRVGNRIRAEGLAGAQQRGPAEQPSPVSSWGSPRSLAWIGAVATVVVGVGITFLVTRETNVVPLRDERAIERATRAAPPVPADEGRLEQAPAAGAKEKDQVLAGRAKEAERSDMKTSASSEVRNFAAPPSAPAAGAMGAGRAQEVRRDERGEDVPVGPTRGPAALYARPPAPEAAPVVPGQPVLVKKHAPAVPMKGQEPQTADKLEAAPSAPAARGPAPAVRRELGVLSKSLAESDAASAPVCGAVHDPAGRSVAGASIVLAETGATTATDAQGRFCIQAPPGEHTLSVLAVGFEPVRQNVSAAAGAPALSVVLQPVAVLGGPWMKDFSGYRSSTTRGTGDVLANLPDSLQGAAREARMLSATATRLKSAAAWEAAADSWWRLILARPVGAAEAEADFQLAAARVHAWEIAPTPARRDAARRAIEGCLASARPGPQRDQARVWQERLLR